MNGKIYIECGGDSDELQRRCREGFRKLLERCGFKGRMPRTVACGGREQTFDDFKTAHANAHSGIFIAMLVDSEEPVADHDKPWEHLKERDGWERPVGAKDEQALLMATCMESWIAADRPTLRKLYEGKLPPIHELELRGRQVVYKALCDATSDCSNASKKGNRSFEVLGALNPVELRSHVAKSFERFERILQEHL